MIEIYSRSKKETQKIARILAEELAKNPTIKPAIFALQGELGSGKTTFTQAFARALGVKEKILSPTFVLVKNYPVGNKISNAANDGAIKNLIHIDCYRLEKSAELPRLGLKDIFKQKGSVILIEWADKIKKSLPRNAVWIKFEHGNSPNERMIKFSF